MIKRIIYNLILILCFLLLSGCQNSYSNNTETTEIITETKESETTSEVGLINGEYTIITALFETKEGLINRKIEYPQFHSEGDTYNCINETIKDMVININSPTFEIKDNEEVNYTGRYEIIYHTKDVVSIEFKSTFFGIGMAYPIASRYGLTIDLNTLTPIPLDNYFNDVESILAQIDADNYTVIEGGMMIFNKEEIKSALISILENDEMQTYINNFYISDNFIYIIKNNMLHSMGDYSIIKFQLKQE